MQFLENAGESSDEDSGSEEVRAHKCARNASGVWFGGRVDSCRSGGVHS